jgi:arylsulfatase A-like enzyme
LRAAPAQLLAWCVVALVNAAVIALTLESPTRWTTAALHHAYDLGHLLCLGLFCYLGVVVWQRWGVRKRGAASAALWAVVFVVDGVMLRADLVPRASKMAGSGSPAPWLLLLTAVAACGIVGAAWAGRLFSRRRFRIAMVFATVQLVAVNHFVLQRHYVGVHLQVTWMAATAMGCSLVGARLPASAMDWAQRSRTGLLIAASLAALLSVATRPPNAVLTRMLSRSGSVLAPFVGRLHAFRAARQMRDRYRDSLAGMRYDVPPSQPALVSAPVVVFVTIDALRADLLEREDVAGKLPNLEKLRDTSLWFSQARTPAPATIVALGSVFSGRYFSQLYWGSYRTGWLPFPHADPTPRLPQLLETHGVATVVYTGSNWMDPDTGVLGRYREHVRIEPVGREKTDHFVHANRQTDAALERLAKHQSGPLFMYMHWIDPHGPYDQVTTEGSDFDRYVAEVAFCDAQIGRLMDALDKPPHQGRGVLIVGADHGEAFGEHDSQYHGVTVYDELARVPLLLSVPGAKAAHVTAPVSLMDVGPTVLDLMGAITPASMMGQSLLPYARGKRPRLERPVVIDSGRHQRAMVFDDGFKVIHDRRRGTVELYDLRADPGELRNLADEFEHDTAVRLDALNAFFARHELRREGYETPWRPP